MQKTFLFLLLCLCINGIAQQNISSGFLKNTRTVGDTFSARYRQLIKSANGHTAKETFRQQLKDRRNAAGTTVTLSKAGLFGASNLNEEAFNTLNASGKVSFYFRPAIYRNKALTVYASYNLNATNNDSVLYSTLIFPEVGKNSFLGTLEWRSFWIKNNTRGKTGHSLAPFFEFSLKNIRSDSVEKGKPLVFSTLNYTLGLKYSFNVLKNAPDANSEAQEASLFTTVYLTSLNVPDEDINNYRAILSKGQLFNPETLTDDFRIFGIKIGGEFKQFGVFADFKAVIGNSLKIPLSELRGFHSNIGITMSTSIFEINND